MDTSTIIWIVVGVVALIALIAVIAWIATSNRRREAQVEARRQEATEMRERAAEVDQAAREREVRAVQADAAAREAQAKAAEAQLEAERLADASREHSSDAERLRAEQAEHARGAAAIDPDVIDGDDTRAADGGTDRTRTVQADTPQHESPRLETDGTREPRQPNT